MPWGKYRGVPLDEIEDDYLAWVAYKAEFASRPGGTASRPRPTGWAFRWRISFRWL
jgi:hypothetical protein